MTLCYLEESFANLRSDTVEFQGPSKEHDFIQESQILFGERLVLLEEEGPWKRVEAVEQGSYEGWIHCESLKEFSENKNLEKLIVQKNWLAIQVPQRGSIKIPLGSILYGNEEADHYQTAYGRFSKQELMPFKEISDIQLARNQLVRRAQSFLDQPYFWGGMTPYDPQNPHCTSFDCSGLVHICYRLVGKSILRNSRQQYSNCRQVSELLPGDLIFTEKLQRPNYISHVMLYEGNQVLIESTEDTMNIRKISFKEKYGQEVQNFKQGLIIGNYKFFFGSIFTDKTAA